MSEHENKPENTSIRCLDLFQTFFRIGLFTLGGGLAMATVMRHELVMRKRWLDDDDFLAEMATATVVPGAIAVNLAFLQGRRLRGTKGALAAVLGTILPSFCIILLVAWSISPLFSNPYVARFFQGCAIAVAGQLAFAGVSFGRKLLHGWPAFIVCAAGLLTVGVLRLHPVLAVLITGALGFCLHPFSTAPAKKDDLP